MAMPFEKPEATESGPRATRDLFDNHAICLLELQDRVGDIEDMPINLIGEDTEFLAIQDARLVRYIIKAILSEVLPEDA